MAFKRIVEMEVGTSSRSVLISDLNITFDITRTRKFSNNIAKFKIYNPADDTVSKMLKKGNSVIFSAGYDDEGTGLIYSGQITESIPSKNPPDPFIEITCGSIQNADTDLSSVTVTLGYKPNTNLSRPINEIGNALGLSVVGLENISSIKMRNGFNVAGTAKEALRLIQGTLERNGMGLFIDNSNLIVFKKGEGYKRAAVKLSSRTGLLESPKLSDNLENDENVEEDITQRALFKSILNYKIVPNGDVDIESSTVNGKYLVDKCQFKGDNFGGDFLVEGEGIVISSSVRIGRTKEEIQRNTVTASGNR